jgi:hypothetical protein
MDKSTQMDDGGIAVRILGPGDEPVLGRIAPGVFDKASDVQRVFPPVAPNPDPITVGWPSVTKGTS